MLARLRQLILSRPARILLGLILAWLLFAWFGFEPLLKWAAPKYVAERSGHVLSIEQARFDPFRLAIDIEGLALTEPDGKPLLGFAGLRIDFEASSLFKRAYRFREIRLDAPVADVALLADGRLNWSALLDSFTSKDIDAESEKTDKQALPRLLIATLAINAGRVNFSDEQFAAGFRTQIDSIGFELHDLSTLPDDKGRHELSLRTEIGAALRWQGELMLNPLRATGEFELDDLIFARVWPYLEKALAIAPPQGRAGLKFSYQLGYADSNLSLQVDKLDVRTQGLTLQGKADDEPSLALESLALVGGQFDLRTRKARIESILIDGGQLSVRRAANGRLNLQDWLPARTPQSRTQQTRQTEPQTKKVATAVSGQSSDAAAAPSAPTPDAGWQIDIGRVGLDRFALRLADQGFVEPLNAAVGQLKLGFKAQANLAADGPNVKLDDIGIELAQLTLASEAIKAPLLAIERIVLEGGKFDLADKHAGVNLLTLSGGRITGLRDANGEMPALAALRTAQSASAAPTTPTGEGSPASPAAASAAKTTAAGGWRYKVDAIRADDFELALRDESVAPAAELTLRKIAVELQGLSQDLQAAVPVRAAWVIEQGGSLAAKGKWVPESTDLDLQIELKSLSLKPAQGYVSQAAKLDLASGELATAGKLLYRNKAFRYAGGFALARLELNEAEGGKRFLGWKSLSSKQFVVTPDALEIGELLLDSPGAKLLIFEDKTVNISRILKPRPASTEPKQTQSEAGKPYRVAIERIRVRAGDLDFADLSLALPFGTRIHALKGEVAGISTEPDRVANMALDGQVDEFGLARVKGQISLSDPAAFTEAQVEFRNVEMTGLTPYSATFAGRRIASGKLSLDLEYKIKDSKLQGENQIVMERLTLGEAVASDKAANLPLDLAIAILQDSDGRIDLGLPVSGALDDPEFSYGSIVWKAIVNVISKIATAPFRALGALVGAGGENMSTLAFDAGSARLLAPEREKLVKLAGALAKRPSLSLTVNPASSTEADRAALQGDQLRRQLAAQLGRTLAPDQAPGPVAFSDPPTRSALEAMFTKQFDAAKLSALKQGFDKAAKPPESAAKAVVPAADQAEPGAGSNTPAGAASRATAAASLHEALFEQLRAAQTLDENRLQRLSTSRAQAVRDEMITRGVRAERIELGKAVTPDASGEGKPDAEHGLVTLSLGALGAKPAR